MINKIKMLKNFFITQNLPVTKPPPIFVDPDFFTLSHVFFAFIQSIQ
jgi:hypothetical protein